MNEAIETSLRVAAQPRPEPQALELAQLHPVHGEHSLLQLPALIGRGPSCTVVLDHASVSREHARIERTERGLQLWDLGSKNRCYVNRRAVDRGRSAPLELGDILRIGELVLRLVSRGQDASSARILAADSALVGGPSLTGVRRLVRLLGPADLAVLITGESGTGKELVARELHRFSGRQGPFIAVNCAALPEALVESELFGHLRGAFTGAARDKPGLFHAASGGTLFLDEVSELPPASQAKLLRTVETGELRRVGAVHAERVDCRILCATNHDLPRDIEAGRFRADLAARLSEAEVRLPPLRERVEDLPLLSRFLLGRAGARVELSTEAAEALACYGWPLNVRELDNVLRMLAVVAEGNTVELAQLPVQLLAGGVASVGRRASSKEEWVLAALRENGGNVRKTSQELGVSRSFVYRCLDKSGVAPGCLRPGTGRA
ncbi:MAG: sigma 54-interacting transcriptional regulator [Deltaproteobacteria bacterium]|nr:sigma 54-interacting transcriptional regulator [Deltaproteobacteria bacterium]